MWCGVCGKTDYTAKLKVFRVKVLSVAKMNHGYQAKKVALEAVGLYGRKETLRTKKLRTRGKVDDTFGEFGTMTFGRTKPFI